MTILQFFGFNKNSVEPERKFMCCNHNLRIVKTINFIKDDNLNEHDGIVVIVTVRYDGRMTQTNGGIFVLG